MTPKLLHILRHSLGIDDAGRGNMYRNHFVTDADGDDGESCKQLCAEGLMIDRGPREMFGGMHCYQVTEAGKEAVQRHAPPPLSRSKQRYEDWLNADSGESFIDWLKHRRRAVRA